VVAVAFSDRGVLSDSGSLFLAFEDQATRNRVAQAVEKIITHHNPSSGSASGTKGGSHRITGNYTNGTTSTTTSGGLSATGGTSSSTNNFTRAGGGGSSSATPGFSTFGGSSGSSSRGSSEQSISSKTEVQRMTNLWQSGKLSNFHYLDFLNCAGGRSVNDFSQYPIFPWVLQDFQSLKLDLGNTSGTADSEEND
ncbi:unnamed protein product, partial [Amoebophrya sp. A25]